MKLINGWRWVQKDWNRFEILLRFGCLTLFRLYADVSDRHLSVTLCNYRLEIL